MARAEDIVSNYFTDLPSLSFRRGDLPILVQFSPFWFIMREAELQKPEMFCKKRCSEKYRKVHTKTPVPESLFNEVAGLDPATSLKEKTPIEVFSDEFCKMLKTTPPSYCFCSTEKYFTNKILKNFLRKEKNGNLYQSFISFSYSKISLFLFSLLPMIYWKHSF